MLCAELPHGGVEMVRDHVRVSHGHRHRPVPEDRLQGGEIPGGMKELGRELVAQIVAAELPSARRAIRT
jgi:hypothetical protein